MDWNRKLSFYKTASILFLILAGVFPVGRFFILRFFVDPQTGFFIKNTFWATLFDYTFFAFSLFLFLLALVYRPRFLSAEERKQKTRAFAPFLIGAPLTAGSRLVFSPNGSVRVFASSFLGFSLITFSVFSIAENAVAEPLEWVVLILAILSGLFFLLQYSSLLPFYSVRRALLSLIPLLWAMLKLFYCFFTASRNATGEYHNWQILSLALIAVFFYAQSLFNLPKRSSYRYALLFSAGMIGLCAILTYVLPILILFAFPSNPYDAFSRFTSIHDLIVQLACALYLGAYAFASAQRLSQFSEEEALCDPAIPPEA